MRLFVVAFIIVAAAFGSPTPLTAAELFPPDGSWKYLKGTAEASSPDRTVWRGVDYDDRSWLEGSAPFAYGRPLSGTRLDDMRGRYSSVYLRRTFVVSNPRDIAQLQLETLSDDGFVAWINGHEIERYNVPDGDLSAADLAVTATAEGQSYQTRSIPQPWTLIAPGTNVLAIHAFNSSLSSSPDFVIDARLTATAETTAPTVIEKIPAPGSTVDALETVEVLFSEPVIGVDAGDLVANGVRASKVEPAGPGRYVFTFEDIPAGNITLAWSADHGITDDTGRPNAFIGDTWSIQVDPQLSYQFVQISEFLADNEKSLLDEDRDPSDWIELYNGGGRPVNLLGWSLTDDPTQLSKWEFPDVVLNPDGYLLVFASQKNKRNPAARLHTNFKLDSDGEYLALVAPNGQVISSVAPKYPAQKPNVSYGRVPGAKDQWAFFAVPTPGLPNSNSGSGFSPEIEFSRSSGTFLEPFDLKLTAAGSNVVIRFTLDGRLPTTDSPVFQQPLAITNTVEVRARAFAEGQIPGPPRSETFLALTNQPIHQATFESTLPILVISTMGRGAISSTRNSVVHFSLYEPEKGKASLLRSPTFATRGAAKVRGSSTEDVSGKSAWAVEWRDEFDQDKKREILGLPAESEWILYSPNNFDPVLIHNPFMYELSNQVGRYAPRTRFVEVYYHKAGPISSNQWWGIYVLEEKISAGKQRVDIDRLDPYDTQAPEVTGGYMMKIDRLDPGDSGVSLGGQLAGLVEPKEREIKTAQRAPQLRYLQSYFSAFTAALNGANYRDPVRGYRAYINVDSWIDHHWLNVLACNVDCLRLSTYFYKPRNATIEFGPIWDFDRSLGSTDGRDANAARWGGGGSDYFFTYPWWGRLFNDADFYQLYIDRYQELRKNEFSTAHLHGLVESLAAQVRPSAAREARRWSANRPRGGVYEREVVLMKTWLANRTAFFDRQLTQPPVLDHPAGRVATGFTLAIDGPAGAKIYYTLDGTDPRQSGTTNVVRPEARLYEGPIRIESNSRVFARAYDTTKRQRATDGPRMDSPWSMPAAATFVITTPALRLTELMYHPQPPDEASPYSSSDFEFLELQNFGATPVDLRGFHFSRGIEFTFNEAAALTALQPGERLILAGNRDALATRYPNIPNLAGQFAGSLADGGERLTLVGPLGETIFDITYSDRWQPGTDGAGYSLVLADEAGSSANPANPLAWRRSSSIGGSPGLPEIAAPVVPHVVINEILPNPISSTSAAIEFYNPTERLVDLSGWYLTDKREKPAKFRIAKGKSIAARGYLVLTKKDFGSVDLDPEGGFIALFSADSEGNLTGWVSSLEYGATETGTALGRVGDVATVLQAPTLGQVNAGPRPSPIMISQIFAPDRTDAARERLAFIQLMNVTDQPVPLFDPKHPDHTWHVRGSVDLDLPPNLVLKPGEVLLCVGFDPARDIAAWAEFRERMGPAIPSRMAGSWKGNLGDQDGIVRLLRPGVSETTGNLTEFVAEEVHYVIGPFPASPIGVSLVRQDPRVAANEPAIWRSATLPGNPGRRDFNGNGLPDEVEQQLGYNALELDPILARQAALGDADGDGYANLIEVAAGTPPDSSELPFTVIPAQHDRNYVHLLVPTVKGRAYALLYRAAPDQGDWIPLKSFIGTGTVAVFPDTLTTTQRYYRLISQ